MTLVMKPVDSPPRNGNTVYPWDEIREGLVSQPDQWIHVFHDVSDSIARRLRAGGVIGFPVEDFEWVTCNNQRTNGVRRCDVLGKYVGPKRKEQ